MIVLLLLAAALPSASIPGCTAERARAGVPLPFGCANALNLEAMLADRDDLARGRGLAPQVGAPAARPVERLRRGEAPALPDAAPAPVSP